MNEINLSPAAGTLKNPKNAVFHRSRESEMALVVRVQTPLVVVLSASVDPTRRRLSIIIRRTRPSERLVKGGSQKKRQGCALKSRIGDAH